MFGVVPAAPLLLLAGLAFPWKDLPEELKLLASTVAAPSSPSAAVVVDRRTHLVASSAAITLVTAVPGATPDDPSKGGASLSLSPPSSADAGGPDPNDGAAGVVGGDGDCDRTVTLPLEPCGGGALCVRVSALAAAGAAPSAKAMPFPRRSAFLPKSAEEDDPDAGAAAAASFRLYRAIVDTGSPYLVVPDCDDAGDLISFPSPDPWWRTSPLVSFLERRGGVAGPGGDSDDARSDVFFKDEPSYPPTEEVYGSKGGSIQWKSAKIVFPRDYASRLVVPARPKPQLPFRDGDLGDDGKGLIVGVMDENLAREAGGSLLGLIKRSNPNADPSKVQLRPTFLEQERIAVPAAASSSHASETPSARVGPDGDGSPGRSEGGGGDSLGALGPSTSQPSSVPISSFSIDGPRRVLTLSGRSLIPTGLGGDVLPLVDLRPLGDFVDHYACLVDEAVFDGGAFAFRGGDDLYGWWKKGRNGRRPVVAVFDTGLTGCLLTRSLWDELERRAAHGGGWNHPSKVTSLEVKILTEDRERRRRAARLRDPRSPRPSVRGEDGTGTKIGRLVREDINGDGDTVRESGGAECVSIVGGRGVAGVPTSSLFYLAPIDLDWFDEDGKAPHVVVLGQAFLAGGTLTIDADDGRATFNAP